MNNINRKMLFCMKGAFAAAGLIAGLAMRAAPSQDVPPLMKTAGGVSVSSSADWEKIRRPEILKLFETQVFGVRPVERPKSLSFKKIVEHRDALLSSAVLKRVKISWSGTRGGQSVIVTAFFPVSVRKSPAPCFILLSRDGYAIGSQRLRRDNQVCTDSLDEKWPVQQMI